MERFFKLKERGTSVKTELVAGMTTFFSMVYILMVNANMFANPFGDGSNPLGVSYGAIYIATAISAVSGTVLAGLLANLPLAQASGMGLNAFFVYTVCIGFGLSYENALVLVLLEGLFFIVLTVTGLRKKIFDAIATTVGAIYGTSTVTTFSEVNTGVAAGGRTGLTSIFCGDGKKIKASSWIIALLFVAMLVLTH